MTATLMHVATPLPQVCDLLCIDIGAERFALPLSTVEEMVDGCAIERTVGPGNISNHMIGVLRIRGQLLPVFDAERVFRVSRCGSEPMVLVLEGSDRLIGLLVDGAEAVAQVSLADLRTPERIMSMDRVLDGVLFVETRWLGLVNTPALVEALERDGCETFAGRSHGS